MSHFSDGIVCFHKVLDDIFEISVCFPVIGHSSLVKVMVVIAVASSAETPSGPRHLFPPLLRMFC